MFLLDLTAMVFFINYLTLRQAVTPDRLLGRVTATMICLTVVDRAAGRARRRLDRGALRVARGDDVRRRGRAGAGAARDLVLAAGPDARAAGPAGARGPRERHRGDAPGTESTRSTAQSRRASSTGVVEHAVAMELRRSGTGSWRGPSRPRAGGCDPPAWPCPSWRRSTSVAGMSLQSFWATWTFSVVAQPAASRAAADRANRAFMAVSSGESLPFYVRHPLPVDVAKPR